MYREGRKRIFEENLEILTNRKYTTSDGREINLKCETPDYYDEPFELEEEPPVEHGTLFTVANEDCVESYKALLRDGYHPALLNMARATHPGGGIENGSGAQEEQLCRRSTLLLSLYQFKRESIQKRQIQGLSRSEHTQSKEAVSAASSFRWHIFPECYLLP